MVYGNPETGKSELKESDEISDQIISIFDF
jgi:hypothetical protein